MHKINGRFKEGGESEEGREGGREGGKREGGREWKGHTWTG